MTAPLSHHHVRWTIRPEQIESKFTCDAPEGAPCRLWCDNDCEDHHKHSPCEMADQGYCVQIPFLTDSNERGEELFCGDEAPLRDAPIHLYWGNQSYLWDYADAGAA